MSEKKTPGNVFNFYNSPFDEYPNKNENNNNENNTHPEIHLDDFVEDDLRPLGDRYKPKSDVVSSGQKSSTNDDDVNFGIPPPPPKNQTYRPVSPEPESVINSPISSQQSPPPTVNNNTSPTPSPTPTPTVKVSENPEIILNNTNSLNPSSQISAHNNIQLQPPKVYLLNDAIDVLKLVKNIKLQNQNSIGINLDDVKDDHSLQFINNVNNVQLDEQIENESEIDLNNVSNSSIHLAKEINKHSTRNNVQSVDFLNLNVPTYSQPKIQLSEFKPPKVSLKSNVINLFRVLRDIKLVANGEIDITDIYENLDLKLEPVSSLPISTKQLKPTIGLKTTDALEIDTDLVIEPDIEHKAPVVGVNLVKDTYQHTQLHRQMQLRNHLSDVPRVSIVGDVLMTLNLINKLRLNVHDDVQLQYQLFNHDNVDIDLNNTHKLDLGLQIGRMPPAEINNQITPMQLDKSDVDLFWHVQPPDIEINNVQGVNLNNQIKTQSISISPPNSVNLRRSFKQILELISDIRLHATSTIDIAEFTDFSIRELNNVVPVQLYNGINNQQISISTAINNVVSLNDHFAQIMDLIGDMRLHNVSSVQVSERTNTAVKEINNVTPFILHNHINAQHISLNNTQPHVNISNDVRRTLDLIGRIRLVETSNIDVSPLTDFAIEELNNVSAMNLANSISAQRAYISTHLPHVNIMNDVRRVVDTIRNMRFVNVSDIDVSYETTRFDNNDLHHVDALDLRRDILIHNNYNNIGNKYVNLRESFLNTLKIIDSIVANSTPKTNSNNYMGFDNNGNNGNGFKIYFEVDDTGNVKHVRDIKDENSFFGGYTLKNIDSSQTSFTKQKETTFVNNIHNIVNDIRKQNAKTLFKFSCEPDLVSPDPGGGQPLADPLTHVLTQFFYKIPA